ncbi:MAG: hypothetical protein MI861_10305, partial [Pirellulales bacterium]|nr:hypothetical protein [Pirellulales bacterium]
IVFMGTGTEIGITLGSVGSAAVDSVTDGNTFTNVLHGVVANNIDGATIIRGNTITSVDDGLLFNQELTGTDFVNIFDNDVESDVSAINFAADISVGAIVDIDANELTAMLHGIDFDNIGVAKVVLRDNRVDADRNGFNFDGQVVAASRIFMLGDQTINADQHGIRFGDFIGFSDIQLAGTTITATGGQGVLFEGDVAASIVTLGASAFTYAFASNGRVFADAEAQVEANSISGGQHGIQFAGTVSDFGPFGPSFVNIVGNTLIEGNGGDGVRFDQSISRSLVRIAGNEGIFGRMGDGLHFGGNIDDALVTIGGPVSLGLIDMSRLGNTNFNSAGPVGSGDPGDVVTTTAIAVVDADGGFASASALANGSRATTNFGTAVSSNRAGAFSLALTDDLLSELQVGAGPTNGVAAALGSQLQATFGGNGVIEGAGDGIEFAGQVSGGSGIDILGNGRIEGLNTFVDEDTLGDAIVFRGAISGAATNILINNNTLIQGDDRGINFASAGTGGPATVTDASVTISGNDEIRGVNEDAILFNANLVDATVVIGGDTAEDRNALIIGRDEGLDIELVDGGTFTVAGNGRIQGETGDGIEFEGGAVRGAEIQLLNNEFITGLVNGVSFEGSVNNSSVQISGHLDGGIFGVLAAIQFDNLNFASVLIGGTEPGQGNLIDSVRTGIHVDSPIVGSNFIVTGNPSVNGPLSAIQFDREIILSQVAIVSNNGITSFLGPTIFFDGSINLSQVHIADNTTISSKIVDAIFFDDPITLSSVNIGATLTDIGNGITFFSGNDQITGGDDGINVDAINSSLFTITDNGLIRGTGGSGVEFENTIGQSAIIMAGNGQIRGGEEGVEFDTNITNDSLVQISGNSQIRGDNVAIQFKDDVDDSLVNIGGLLPGAGNGQISGGRAGIEFTGAVEINDAVIRIVGNETIDGTNFFGDGIRFAFGSSISGTDTLLSIAGNTSISGPRRGINVRATIDDATVSIRNNRISGLDAIRFNRAIRNANVVIGGPLDENGNELIAGMDGIDVGPINGGRFVVQNNQVNAGSEGVQFGGAIRGDALVQVTENELDAT